MNRSPGSLLPALASLGMGGPGLPPGPGPRGSGGLPPSIPSARSGGARHSYPFLSPPLPRPADLPSLSSPQGFALEERGHVPGAGSPPAAPLPHRAPLLHAPGSLRPFGPLGAGPPSLHPADPGFAAAYGSAGASAGPSTVRDATTRCGCIDLYRLFSRAFHRFGFYSIFCSKATQHALLSNHL